MPVTSRIRLSRMKFGDASWLFWLENLSFFDHFAHTPVQLTRSGSQTCDLTLRALTIQLHALVRSCGRNNGSSQPSTHPWGKLVETVDATCMNNQSRDEGPFANSWAFPVRPEPHYLINHSQGHLRKFHHHTRLPIKSNMTSATERPGEGVARNICLRCSGKGRILEPNYLTLSC